MAGLSPAKGTEGAGLGQRGENPVSVTGNDTLKTRRTLTVDGKTYDYFSLDAAAKAAGLGDIEIGRAHV